MFPAATAVTVARNVARRGQHLSVQLIHYNLCILRPDKRRWAVLSEVQPLDKYIWKSVSQVALFAYSSICETLHTNIIYS